MIFDIITIFPDFFDGFLKYGVIAKALSKNKDDRTANLKINIINLREFGLGRHRITDDRPFGGGPGMVMLAEPIYQALKKLLPERFSKKVARKKSDTGARVILLSPQGKKFSQKEAARLARYSRIVLICGRYEGVDERIMDFVDEEISIGDYVISGGEPAAMVVADAVARLLPDADVVKERASVENDSFSNGADGILDYPHYTRPAVWRSKKVPAVLLSGNHKKIAEWRKKQAIINTRKKRPDLLNNR